MSLLLALMVQAAAPPARPAPPKVRPVDSSVALDAFQRGCWAHLRDPDALRAAVAEGPLPLVQVAREREGPTETWRSDQGTLTYTASDSLPAGIPPRQCTLTVRLSGVVDQLTLANRIATAFKLSGGSTRTGAGVARTGWDVAAPDKRVVRLLAVTRNAASGQTDLRLSALLLPPR